MEDFGFKFSIGQFVQHVGKLPKEKRNKYDFGRACRFVILERDLNQCYGGVQRFYTLRAVDGRGAAIDRPFRFSEPELCEEVLDTEE